MEELYYLINRPISHNGTIVDSFVGPLSDATGLTAMTVKQKLQGTAYEVFQTSRDKEKIDFYHKALKSFNIPSFIISKSAVKSAKTPILCKSLKEMGGNIILLDGSGAEIITLDGTAGGLLVLGAVNVDRIKTKRINKMAITKSATFSPMEIINLIFMNQPVMDLCVSGSNKIIRIDSRRFNFNSLGKDRNHSSSENLKVIIKKIQGALKSSMIDTGFGENSLPFLSNDYGESNDLNNNGEKVLEDFTVYSKVAFVAAGNKLFNKVKLQDNLTSDAPVLKELGGALWASPLLLTLPGLGDTLKRGSTAAAAEDLEKHFEEEGIRLPAPPVHSISFSSGGNFGDLHYFITSRMKTLRQMGPPVLFFPLVGISMVSSGAAYLASMVEPMVMSSLCMGLVLVIHSFVLLKRKRTIENHPTANIGRMPMGEVEIMGRARQKYYLKAPYSLLDCIYYSYKVYSYERDARGGRRRVLKGGGESGPVPFYLEDDTGKVVINPEGAIIKGGVTETHDGNAFGVFSSSSYGGSDKIIVETVIPAGMKVYVLGYGQRVIADRKTSRRIFSEKLRDLKLDANKMKSFDSDGDGNIDGSEWEEAKAYVREEALREKLENAGKKNDIEVTEYPSGGLFYISDSHEEGILTSLSWRVPLSFCLGVIGIIVGFLYLPRLIILRNLLLARLFEW